MKRDSNISCELDSIMDHHDSNDVTATVQSIYGIHFPENSFSLINAVYTKINDLYNGRYGGYKKCNTEYHDLHHTEQVFMTSSRIIDGYILSGNPLSLETSQKILLSALFHDTGFIQEEWDNDGTGAKYTSEYDERSKKFVVKNAHTMGCRETDIDSICRIIQAINIRIDFDSIEFESHDEKIAGMILGTADLLGQMASRTYIEKLLFLYREFREGGIIGYNTEFDILKKTIGFYEFTKERLINSYDSMFMVAKKHFEKRYHIDRNLYTDAIDKNIEYLKKIIKDTSMNFRHKLRRINRLSA